MNLLFQRTTGSGKARSFWHVFSSCFEPSRSWTGIGWLRAFGLSQDGRKRRQVSQDDGSQRQSWSALEVEMCRVGGVLVAVLTLVMFEAYLRPGEMLSFKTFKFPRTNGGSGWYSHVLKPGPQGAKPSVLDLFSPSTDLQTFFLNRGIQCARLDPFLMTTKFFSTRIQEVLCILAIGRTLAVMLSPPVTSLSSARKRRPLRSATRLWRLQSLCLLGGRHIDRELVFRRMFASGQSMHQFQNSCLARQSFWIVFVETQWTTESDQQERCFRHSPL